MDRDKMIQVLEIARGCNSKAVSSLEDKIAQYSIVYVGTMEWPFRRMIMFHMSSLDMDALHDMARKIGIQRKWFQEHYKGTDFYDPHYDICKSKKVLAMKNGAVEINDWELVRICFPKMQFAFNKKQAIK